MTTPRLVKLILAVLLSLPLGWLAWLITLDIQNPGSTLGADPGERVVHYLGEWSLRILLVAFSITPLRRLLRSSSLARCRRMAGLFAFSYVSLHLTAYLFFFLQFSWAAFAEDLLERPYITAGLAALLCLLPMAVTSTTGWQRRLRHRWRTLHRLIYPAIALALLHLWWLTKEGYGEWVVYALWFVALLGARIWKPAMPLRHGAA